MLLSQCTIKQKQSEKQIFSFRNKNNSVGSQKSETLTFHSVTISIYIYIYIIIWVINWNVKYFTFKGQCHKIFPIFLISWMRAIWAPGKQANVLLLKNSFSWRYSRKIRLHAVLAWAESGSAQANTARSRTLRRLTLCGVKNWNFRKSKIG